MMAELSPGFLALVAVVGGLSAQTEQQHEARAARSHADIFFTSIHDEVAVDEAPGGTWATAASYKVSFHDGMRFVPVLGSDFPENLPLAWETASVTAGGIELLREDERPATWRDDLRYEYRYGAIVEAYDVKPNGVEQTFVMLRRPTVAGDLVVRGRLTTPLHSDTPGDAHRPLVFQDDRGTPIVEYGAATAIDASGRRLAMPSRIEDGEIVLTVDGAWLESAEFPLTIDPLLSSLVLDASDPDVVNDAALVHDPFANEILVVLTRDISASDSDIFGINYLSAYTLPVTVFLNSDEFVSLRDPEIAFVPGAQRWVTAFEAEFYFSATPHKIGYHTHVTAALTLDTAWFTLGQNAQRSRRNPDVGGTAALGSNSTRALIISESDDGTTNSNSGNTRLRADILDVATNTVISFHNYHWAGTDFDREKPTVCQARTGDLAPWVFCFQERRNDVFGDDWEICVSRFGWDGSWISGAHPVGQATTNSVHNVTPHVAGESGHYMVTYSSTSNTGFNPGVTAGPNVRATRFDWPEHPSLPSTVSDFTVQNAAAAVVNVELAFDTDTDGHWAGITHLASPVFGGRPILVHRILDEGVAESVTEGGAGLATGHGVAYDSVNDRFPIFYTDPNSSTTAGNWLVHPTSTPVAYGLTCGNFAPWFASIGADGNAISGNRNFRVTLSGGTSTSVMLMSNASANLPLDFAGFTGCDALVDLGAGFIGSAPGTPSGPYDGVVDLPIPWNFVGTVFCQWAFVAPGINPNDLAFSDGLLITVVQ